MDLLLLALIVMIPFFYWVAKQFYQIAAEKGFPEKKYLWLSFFLPFVGYALVIALPDRGDRVD